MIGQLTLTPSTVILLLVIVACAVLAVRRIMGRGLCDCGDRCDRCSHGKAAACSNACAHCGAADDMVRHVESSLRK